MASTGISLFSSAEVSTLSSRLIFPLPVTSLALQVSNEVYPVDIMCSGDGKKCRTSSRGKTPNPSVSAMMMVPMPIPITEMGSTPMRTMNISAIDEMRSGTVATAPIIVSVNSE
eukprot:scaffold188759_cov23-Cyclotella_meneghiniana.AAC.1